MNFNQLWEKYGVILLILILLLLFITGSIMIFGRNNPIENELEIIAEEIIKQETGLTIDL